MKTLSENDLKSISAGRLLSDSELLIDGALMGGLVGGLIAITTNHRDPASLVIGWAIGGALVNTIL